MAFSKYCSDLKYGHILVSWFFYRKTIPEKVKCNLYLLNFILTNGKGIVFVRLELKHFCLLDEILFAFQTCANSSFWWIWELWNVGRSFASGSVEFSTSSIWFFFCVWCFLLNFIGHFFDQHCFFGCVRISTVSDSKHCLAKPPHLHTFCLLRQKDRKTAWWLKIILLLS